MHFLQDSQSDPAFYDPRKKLSLNDVYARMEVDHLSTCPSPGANRQDRFVLIGGACLSADTFIVAARDCDLAAIFSKLNKEEIPLGKSSVNTVNFCFPLPPDHLRRSTNILLTGGKDVVKPNRLVVPSPVSCPSPVSEGVGSAQLTERRRLKKLPRRAPPRMAHAGTQTAEGLLVVKKEPFLEYSDLDEEYNASQQIRCVRIEDHHLKAASYLIDRIHLYSRLVVNHYKSQFAKVKKTSINSAPPAVDHDLTSVAAHAAANAELGLESGFFQRIFGKPFPYVSTWELVKVLELPNEAFQQRLFGDHVKTLLHQHVSPSGVTVTEALYPPKLSSESSLKEDLCKNPSHRNMIPNPNLLPQLRIDFVNVEKRWVIPSSGSQVVKKIRLHDGSSAPVR